jgi:coiled-coil domain-containing protein 115
MASQLPSPPPSPLPSTPATASPNSDLTTKLDDLLASYLTLLDTYTTLRNQLSTHFSSGFFSLATANRNAAAHLGVGRTFGRDQYDERMRSCVVVNAESRKVAANMVGKAETETEESTFTETEVSTEAEKEEADDIDEQNNSTADTSDSTSDTEFEYTHYIITSPPSSSTKPKDPIHQFHPFPPPPLRQTQSYFKEAVQDTVPLLLTTFSQMNAIESDIWDVRKQLGILDEYNYDALESESETRQHTTTTSAVNEAEQKNSSTLSKRTTSLKTTSPSTRSSVQNLVSRSRPSEPRTRVLKVD